MHSSSKTIFLLPIFLVSLSSCSIWDSCAKYSGKYNEYWWIESSPDWEACIKNGCIVTKGKYHKGIPGKYDTGWYEFTCAKKK